MAVNVTGYILLADNILLAFNILLAHLGYIAMRGTTNLL